MGGQQASGEAEHQAHQHDAQHRLLGGITGQAQVDATVKQHQAHQQAHHRAQTRTQVEGFYKAKAGAADHQTGAEQQHHPRQAGEPGQGLSCGPGKNRDPPEQTQPLRRHSSRALNLGST